MNPAKRGRAWFRLLIALVALCVAGSAGTASAAEPPGSVALAIDTAFADPSFITDGVQFYAYATGGGAQGAFPFATAPSMDGPWTGRGRSMASLPGWVGQTPQGDFNLWAPSVIRNSAGSYVMYFTANNRATDDRCVGVATATAPGGPFDPAPEPLVCGGAGVQVIDATGFLGAEGQRFVVYKVKKPVDGATLFEIRAHRTDSSGTVRIGPAKTLITMRDANIEAPDVIANGGRVFLFVARGSFTDCSYRTEVWHAGALWTDTWQRTGTLMSTAATGLCGPGGAEVRRIGGDTWMVFHAWKCAAGVPDCRPGDPTERRRYRAMYTGLIGWGADGRTPHVLNHR